MILLVMMCSSNLLQIQVQKWYVVYVVIAFLKDGCYQGYYFSSLLLLGEMTGICRRSSEGLVLSLGRAPGGPSEKYHQAKLPCVALGYLIA